jgi:hypothetical protein
MHEHQRQESADWICCSFYYSERLVRQRSVNIKCLFIDTALRGILPSTGLASVRPRSPIPKRCQTKLTSLLLFTNSTPRDDIEMPLLPPPAIPFWAHILTELPASINFFLRPSEQLSSPAPQAHAIIRQYAILLLVSNIIASIFALRPVDATSRHVGGALSIYHAAPLVRAARRIISRDEGYGGGLGGPVLHLVVHGVCFVTLGGLFLSRPTKRRVS